MFVLEHNGKNKTKQLKSPKHKELKQKKDGYLNKNGWI
jgi:hypothetical protein